MSDLISRKALLEALSGNDAGLGFDSNLVYALITSAPTIEKPQQQWVGLSNDTVLKLESKFTSNPFENIRAIEAKLKELNT